MNGFNITNYIRKIPLLAVFAPALIGTGIVGLYISTIIQNPYTFLYPLALIASPILLFISLYCLESTHIKKYNINRKYILLLFIAVFSILVWQYQSVGFRRTSYIIYITFILYIISSIYILTKPHPVLGLITILIVGMANRLTAYYGSALYNGVDIYSHSRNAQLIATSGSLDVIAGNKYFYAPFYHLLTAAGSLIYDVSIRDAIALTSFLAVTILPVLVVYIITIHFWDPQVGLISSFFYISADHAIRWGIHVSTTSLGIAFFSILFLSLIKYIFWTDTRQYSLLLIFLGALMFTHQISLFIGIISISFIVILTAVFSFGFSKPAVNIGLLAGIIMYLDSIVTMYTGGNDSFFDVVLGSLFLSLTTAGTETRPAQTLPQDPSISPTGAAALTLPQVAGSALLLTFAIIGALYWISRQRTDRELIVGIELSGLATVLLLLTLLGPMIGLSNLLPTRWWPFTYIFLAVLSAPGLLVIVNGTSQIISNMMGRNSVGIVITIFVMFLIPYVVLMGGNYAGAYDNPLLDTAPGAERYSIQESEKDGLIHLSQYTSNEQQILSDERGKSILSRYYKANANTISIEYNNFRSIRTPSILFDREYLSTKHAQYYIRLDQNSIRVHGSFKTEKIPLKQQNRIYNNGEDQVLYLPN